MVVSGQEGLGRPGRLPAPDKNAHILHFRHNKAEKLQKQSDSPQLPCATDVDNALSRAH